MKKQVLISGAGIAGLTLAYWLHRFGYSVTVIEISPEFRKGGAPIDVRGEALEISKKMGIWEEIKAEEFLHTDTIVNAENESLVSFSINDQPEYRGDIEIHRSDLLAILYENLSDEIEFLFDNRIKTLAQHKDGVSITFEKGPQRHFSLVFGADGTHSSVRKFVFGDEKQYSKFYGAYFALIETPTLASDNSKGAVMFKKPGKMGVLYPFKDTTNAMLAFRSSKLNWDHRNPEQQKQILKSHFKDDPWRIPEILEMMLHSNNLYFDEVCQIHMPSWSKGRVALVGDAAHTTSFPTGMGTSLAMEGAAVLARELYQSHDDFATAFAKYYKTFHPFAENVQSRINRGLKWLLPETEEGVQAAVDQFKK